MFPWWRYLALAMAVISLLIELTWTVRAAKYRRPIGFAGLIIVVYFIVLYSFILWFSGSSLAYVKNGALTTIGVTIILILHIADIIIRPEE